MAIPHISLSIPTPQKGLSSCHTISGGPSPAQLFLSTRISPLSLTSPAETPFRPTTIRMGGGPRTYPGGVSKWQWKRMQAKKSKQLLKARLARERQIYEMRKRAELKAAVSELERPWEVVDKAPTLFSVSADDQVKVLADRFQRPGGFDLWSERDGPELFRPDNGLRSARFFPKGVVHSIKPYGRVEQNSDEYGDSESSSSGPNLGLGNDREKQMGLARKQNSKNSPNYEILRRLRSGLDTEGNVSTFGVNYSQEGGDTGNQGNVSNGKFRKKRNRRKYLSNSEPVYSRNDERTDKPESGSGESRSNGHEIHRYPNSDLYDMSLQNDGSYGFESEDGYAADLSNV